MPSWHRRAIPRIATNASASDCVVGEQARFIAKPVAECTWTMSSIAFGTARGRVEAFIDPSRNHRPETRDAC
ncbi:hypothetical protein DIE16_27755 [Burkholderia sp. Bp9090]|nr:hypothetical protein DIE16_27755 [Burkholderia sp. Bp9090]